MPSALISYIEKARDKKLSNEQITNSLIAAGWQKEQIAEALSLNADLPVPPPPPPSVPHVGMWVGFLYILFFISLYILATSIGGILDTWIDKTIPSLAYKTSSFFDFDTNAIVRGYISAIFVSYPIFLALAIILKKQLTKQPMVANLRSRKILIYITLIGTFLIMLGNIITAGYDFLAGNITGNALGHLFVTLLIAGSIFGYFIMEVKYDRKPA